MNYSKLTLTISVTIVGLASWFLIDFQYRRRIDYDWYSYLVNTTTGDKIKPNELLDIRRVFYLDDEYVNSTNAIDRINSFEFQANLVHPLEIDQSYSNEQDLAVSGWPVADQVQCDNDLRWIRDRLLENRNYPLLRGRLGFELTRLIDSFGKPQTAFYSGLTTWTGSYERCLKTNLNNSKIKMRYCWARMRFKSWSQVQPVRPQPRIRIGVCLPETCDTSSYSKQRHIIEWLIKLDLNEFYRDNLELDSMFCLPDERSPIRQIDTAGHIYIGLVVGWIVVVLVGTVIYEVDKRRQQSGCKESLTGRWNLSFRGQPSQSLEADEKYSLRDRLKSMGINALEMIRALSIHKSLELFMQYNPGKLDKYSRVDLRCLDMIKFLMTIMIVVGHGIYMMIRFTRTQFGKFELATSGTTLTIMSAGRFVDSFFLLFGLLASYTLLRKFKVDRLISPSTWLAYNISVMIRLMPVFLPLYWFSKLISIHTGAGPWWDYGVYDNSLKGYCRQEKWWKTLILTGFTGFPPSIGCLPTAWFLVVYTQLSLTLPPFVYTISKLSSNFRRLSLVLFVCLVSSMAINVRLYGQSTLDADSINIYGALVVDLIEKFESSGMMGALGRAGTVAIGCYAGYLLRSYELDHSYRWSRLFRTKISLLLIIALNILVYMLPYIGDLITQQTNHKSSLLEFILSNTILSLAWSTSNAALIILASTTYRRTAAVRFLRSRLWHSANKLGLAIYLVHWEILFMASTGYEQGPSIGFLMDFWKLSAFGLVVSIPVALMIYILFEAPLISLMRFYQNRSVMRAHAIELEDDLGKKSTKSATTIAS